MNNYDLRSIIVKISDRLTPEDREQFHFYFGNNVSRTTRDDLTLAGTLNLINELFDRDKIKQRDFDLLIDAFDTIQCVDAATLLRGHSPLRLVSTRLEFGSSRTSETNGNERFRSVGRHVVVVDHATAERFDRRRTTIGGSRRST